MVVVMEKGGGGGGGRGSDSGDRRGGGRGGVEVQASLSSLSMLLPLLWYFDTEELNVFAQRHNNPLFSK